MLYAVMESDLLLFVDVQVDISPPIPFIPYFLIEYQGAKILILR
jgi:hypothetical protein